MASDLFFFPGPVPPQAESEQAGLRYLLVLLILNLPFLGAELHVQNLAKADRPASLQPSLQ